MCRDKEVKSKGEDKEVVKKMRKTDIKMTVMARRVDKEMKQGRVVRDQRTESFFDS